MNLDPCILPDIRVINLIPKLFTYNRSYTSNELSTRVEQSQDLMLRSTASFLIVTHYSARVSVGLVLIPSLILKVKWGLELIQTLTLSSYNQVRKNQRVGFRIEPIV